MIDQHEAKPEGGHGVANIGEHGRRLVEQRVAFDRRVRPDQGRQQEPDDQRGAGQDERRQGGRADQDRDLLAGRDRDAEVAVEEAVGAAADRGGQHIRDAARGEQGVRGREDPQHLAIVVRVAQPHPAAVLDGNRLVQPPRVLELLSVRLGHPGVVGELRGGTSRRRQEDPVDDDGDPEQDRDCLDDPPDDVLGHACRSVRLDGVPRRAWWRMTGWQRLPEENGLGVPRGTPSSGHSWVAPMGDLATCSGTSRQRSRCSRWTSGCRSSCRCTAGPG